MEDLIQLESAVEVGGSRRGSRAVALVAVLALVVGGLVLARHAAAPASTDKIVNVDNHSTPVDGVGGVLGRSLGFGAVPAQIDVGALIRSIVCPILTALVAQIPFLAPFIQPIRVAFGCLSA